MQAKRKDKKCKEHGVISDGILHKNLAYKTNG